jgi:hypothetical protein
MIRFGQRTKLVKNTLMNVIFKFEDDYIKVTKS